jgi:hypothetical protein
MGTHLGEERVTAPTYVTVTGTLGTAARGAQATFTPSGWVADAGAALTFPPAPQAVTLNSAGSFSTLLLATDNSGLVPSTFTWTVAFTGITGVAPYQASFPLPYAGGSVQDISSLI